MRPPPTDPTASPGLRDPHLSVVIPTYNERETIGRTVSKVLDRVDPDAELIVVDDDSPDRTWRVVSREHGDDERVRVERRTAERGLGSAIVHGITHARGEYCLVMDADLQHPPDAIPRMVDRAEDGADVVVGTRYGDGGRVDGWSLYRRLISHGAVALAQLALPRARTVSDPISGFFLVRTDVVDGLDLEPRSWKLLLDVLVDTDVPVREVGFRFRAREHGSSKLTAGDCATYLGHVMALAIAGRLNRRPVDLSAPASDHGE